MIGQIIASARQKMFRRKTEFIVYIKEKANSEAAATSFDAAFEHSVEMGEESQSISRGCCFLAVITAAG